MQSSNPVKYFERESSNPEQYTDTTVNRENSNGINSNHLRTTPAVIGNICLTTKLHHLHKVKKVI